MTSRAKNITNRIEIDIERNREESNWLKVIDLAEQLKDKSPEYGCLGDFLIGEGKLENYLEEWPPLEINIDRARNELIEAKRYLTLVYNEQGSKAGVSMDANLLLGKLNYACGYYATGIKHFNLAELQNLSQKKLPLRSLRIVAESYAAKALCLQKDPTATSKFKRVEKEEEMLKCFSLAGDLSLLYMQKLEKEQIGMNLTTGGAHSPQPLNTHKSFGVIVEQALQEGPKSLLLLGKPEEAVERYRSLLYAEETQAVLSIRLKFMCEMAKLLLQGLVGDKYRAPNNTLPKPNIWKPKCYASLNQFVPRNECEETILLLLIAESMAVRNTVLSQSSDFKEARLSAYQDAIMVYDLLTVATVRWGQVSLLQESLERSMKFSFEEVHLWKQHALSLLVTGQYIHALAVFKQVIRLEPHNSSNCLIAAKICYEHLNSPTEGTNFSIEAKKKDLQTNSILLGRCYLYIGIGYYLQAEQCLLKKVKDDLMKRALENFRKAVELEPNDYLCQYYLSFQLAHFSQLTEAQEHIRISLELNDENSSALHLLVLLLTAKREHKNALILVKGALDNYPDSLNLMYVRAYLELHEEGGEKALTTAKQMLELWKNLYEGQTNSDVPECDRKSDTRSVFQLYTSEMSDRDSSSLQLHNTAASRMEQALSEVASSLSSFSPRPGPQRAWLLQVEIWLLLAELYLALDQPSDVQQCIHEATQIYPLSHHIIHMKGLLHMHKKEWAEAKLCFQNAIAINPQHVKSLQELGLVYHYLGLQGLAEMTLKDAIRIEPKNHVSWYNIGKVFEALGEFEKASDAMSNALIEETNNPILPFNSVPLCFE